MAYDFFWYQPDLLSTSGYDPLEAGLRALINSDTALQTIIAANLFRDAIGQSAGSAPSIFYLRTGFDSPEDLDGTDGTAVDHISLTCTSGIGSDCDRMATRLQAMFVGKSLTIPGGCVVDGCSLSNKVHLPQPPPEGSDNWTYRTVIDLEFRIKTS